MAALFAAVHPTLAAPQAASQIDDEEYSVYSVILAPSPKTDSQAENKKLILIRDRIIPYGMGSWKARLIATGVSQDTIDEYRNKNDREYLFERRFQSGLQYQLISNEEKISPGSPEFKTRYPNAWGIQRFSRVGFNSDKTKAVLYAESICGARCGTGEYLILEKKDGAWKVVKNLMIWVS